MGLLVVEIRPLRRLLLRSHPLASSLSTRTVVDRVFAFESRKNRSGESRPQRLLQTKPNFLWSIGAGGFQAAVRGRRVVRREWEGAGGRPRNQKAVMIRIAPLPIL